MVFHQGRLGPAGPSAAPSAASDLGERRIDTLGNRRKGGLTMPGPEPHKQRRGLVAIDGAMALIVILLIVQMWLLSATLEAYLNGRSSAVLPATIFSGLLFSASLALNFLVDRLDRESRRN